MKRKFTMDSAKALRLGKNSLGIEESCNEGTWLLLNRRVRISAHKDRPEQTRNNMTKPKWLIRNIPSGGPNAPAKLKVRKK